MAIFRNRDRGERRAWKSYHASGVRAAKNHYDFSDPERGEESNLHDAWLVYRNYMIGEGQRHVTLLQFVEEMKRKRR
jgi:hypothetical protein